MSPFTCLVTFDTANHACYASFTYEPNSYLCMQLFLDILVCRPVLVLGILCQ